MNASRVDQLRSVTKHTHKLYPWLFAPGEGQEALPRLDNGSLAGIRRWTPARAIPAPVYRLLHLAYPELAVLYEDLLHETHNGDQARAWFEKTFATGLTTLLLAAPSGSSGAFGKALAQAQLAEVRLERLLESSGERLADELRAAASYLKRANVGFHPRQLFSLLLFNSDCPFPSVRSLAAGERQGISREYYYELFRIERNTTP